MSAKTLTGTGAPATTVQGGVPIMENKTVSNKSFSMWAKEIYNRDPEIIKMMYKAADPFEKAIASMIMKAAGVGQVAT